jgi:hypothetical protein
VCRLLGVVGEGGFGGWGASFGPGWLGHYGAGPPRGFRRARARTAACFGFAWRLGSDGCRVNGTRRRSRLGVTRGRRVGGQTRLRRGTEGLRVGGDSVRSRSVSGRVGCVRMAQGQGCKTEAQRVKMASALAALVARRGNKNGRNPSGFRPLVVGRRGWPPSVNPAGGARRAYPRPQSSSA